MKALFVCTANSCRSVMAEFLFRHKAAEGGKNWESRSCGIAAEPRFRTPDGVKKALARYGMQEVHHVPQLISRIQMGWATDVFAMAANHKEVLMEMYPEHHAKIHLFLEHTGLGARDVADPIGKPVERYYECCDLIEQGIDSLFHPQNHANIAEPPRS